MLGLKRYLRREDIQRLYTVDLVCHGVPSPLIWKEYLRLVLHGKGIRSVSFRDKSRSWHHSELRIEGEDGFVLSENHGANPYSLLFFGHYTLRPCCSVCPFSNMSRVGDITLGDFWGIENVRPDLDDDKGISLLLVNSEKGKRLLSGISPFLDVYPSDAESCLQPNLRCPSAPAADRDVFWAVYRRFGLKRAMYIYGGSSGYVLRLLKKVIKKTVEVPGNDTNRQS